MKAIKISTRAVMMILFMLMTNCISINKASAQNGMGKKFKNMTPAQRADFQTGMMKSKLKLDTQQLLKVQALNLKYALLFEPIIKSDVGRFSKLRQAMALQQKKDDELQYIFTTPQYKLYKDFEDTMRKKMMAKVN